MAPTAVVRVGEQRQGVCNGVEMRTPYSERVVLGFYSINLRAASIADRTVMTGDERLLSVYCAKK